MLELGAEGDPIEVDRVGQDDGLVDDAGTEAGHDVVVHGRGLGDDQIAAGDRDPVGQADGPGLERRSRRSGPSPT